MLHKSIREEGGAYGGGASNNSLSGNFYFYAYRDPNIATTLEAFDQAVDRIVQGNFEASDLEEAKLEIIQSMDSPISPGSRGNLAYAWLQEGKTLEVRQAFRDKVLAITSEEVIQAVKEQIVPKIGTATIVSFAGEELLEKENALLQKPLKIESI